MRQGRSHRDPVSCRSCRAKKLRCNRVQPCSNCTTRGIECHFLNRPPASAHFENSVEGSEDLLQRVQRLEGIIDNLPSNSPTSKHVPSVFAGPPAQQNYTYPSSAEQNEDAQTLESVGTREALLLSDLSNDFRIEVKPIPEILGQLRSSNKINSAERVLLPTYTDATVLLHGYESNVDHVYRILHVPTLQSQMRSFYLGLARNEPVPVGRTALLAAVFALALFFHNSLQIGQLVRTDSDSICLVKAFSKATMDALDHSRRTTSGSIEDVQAYILASVIMFYLDGFSARGRVLASTAIMVARDIGLQNLDAKERFDKSKHCDRRELIDLEVKRRVMWHLAATDWLSSLASGPQEGTYLLQPSHMHVKLPSLSSDHDLCIGENTADASEILPGMTYFLERVRLAELCRTIIDKAPPDSTTLLAYDYVVAVDGDLLEYLKSLPYFFRLDAESRARAKDLEIVHPTLGLLRYLITQAVHSRRCKLHQKLLLRRSADASYEYSRAACLDSARVVIQSFESLAEGGCSWVMVARMGLAVHYLHLALAVFVMDLCCNPAATNRTDIKFELWSALFRLEGLRNASALLDRSLSSLHRVLQKYEILVDDTDITSVAASSFSPRYTQQATGPVLAGETDGDHANTADSGFMDSAFDTYLNDAWESAIQLNTDEAGWDAFFDRFDNHLL